MFVEDENTVMFINNGGPANLVEFLKGKGLSGRLIAKALKNGEVYIGNNVSKGREIVDAGAKTWLLLGDEESDMSPQKMDIGIVYEDYDLLVIDKDPLILVHPTPNHPDGTLSNGVADYFLLKGLRRKVRIINRLDRDTSGVVIFAKNSFGHQQLARQMDEGTTDKRYLAVVHGLVTNDRGEIDKPLGKHPDGIRQMITEKGSRALTRYTVLERFRDGTLLELELLTGRTHQIRVHLASLGHPIMGDHLYSEMDAPIGRQALHASQMGFNAPRSGEWKVVKAKLPDDMENLLKTLKISKI